METVIKSLVAALRTTIPMLVRTASASGDYLEGVLSRQALERCEILLRETLGPPIKEFSKAATFEPPIQKVIDRIGGIRFDQCVFLKQGGEGHVAYAVLWPWASDATRITIKVGVLELAS